MARDVETTFFRKKKVIYRRSFQHGGKGDQILLAEADEVDILSCRRGRTDDDMVKYRDADDAGGLDQATRGFDILP